MAVAIDRLRKLFTSRAKTESAPSSPFTRALKEGLLAGLVVVALGAAWMSWRAPDIAMKLQPLFAATKVAIERPVSTPAPSEAQKTVAPDALPTDQPAGLFETTADGKTLPIIRFEDDLTPFDAYKKPFTPVAGRPMIALVMVDYGLSEKTAQAALETLPGALSMVLTPYARDTGKWAVKARQDGHELWLSLPLESPLQDGGPHVLRQNASLDEYKTRLTDILSTVTGYAGLVTPPGHVFKNDDPAAASILSQIYGRGLAMAESNPDIAAFGLPTAMESGHPYAQNNFWLDADVSPEGISAALKETLSLAQKKGKAIAFFHPYPIVLQKVRAFVENAEDGGYQIAPLSATVQ